MMWNSPNRRDMARSETKRPNSATQLTELLCGENTHVAAWRRFLSPYRLRVVVTQNLIGHNPERSRCRAYGIAVPWRLASAFRNEAAALTWWEKIWSQRYES